MMDDSNSKPTSHAHDAVVRIATNKISPTQDGTGKMILDTDGHNQMEDVNMEVSDVELQAPESTAPTDEKVKLQDQTNLLPLKQLLIVFAGLSCALFCTSIPLHNDPMLTP